MSYTRVDQDWAEWVSWQLEDAGFSVLVQAWDFTPGTNWVQLMDDGVRSARRTMAVVSAAYVESVFGGVEWQAAFAADPTGRERRLLPVRVEDCALLGLLGQLVCIDVFDVAEHIARERLRSAARLAVSGSRQKPAGAVPLPPPRAAAGPAAFPGRVWMVPATTPRVVVPRPGPESELLAALLDRSGGLVGVTTAVEGAGGFGKTTLVSQVCRGSEVRAAYPGGLLWAEVGQEREGPALAGLLNGLSETLAGTASVASDPHAAAVRLADLLAVREPALLVVDDVWTRGQLTPFLTVGRSCRLLVTTRVRGVVPAGGRPVLVDQMTDSESVTLLSGAGAGIPGRLARRLLDLTGRWPVLLALATETLAADIEDGASPAEAAAWLVARLEEGGPATLDVDDETARDRAVEATVEASVSRLAGRGQPPGKDTKGAERYRELGIFPEDADVPAAVVALLWGATGGLDSTASERLRRSLVRLRLAGQVWEAGTPVLSLHDVIRAYLRHSLGASRLRATNALLVEAGRTLLPPGHDPPGGCVPWWLLPGGPAGDYLARRLIYHMVGAGLSDQAAAVATDLRWVEASIRRTGSTLAAESDLATAGGDKAALLARALARHSHLLPGPNLAVALGPTLAARLCAVPELGADALSFAASLPSPRLEPAWPLPDPPDPAQLRSVTGHAGGALAVAFSPNGAFLASGGADQLVRLRDLRTGTERALPGHTGHVLAVAFSPDGATVASGSDDGTVRLWDTTSGGCRATLTGHRDYVNAVAFSPDGATVASGSDDGTVRLWDTRTGTEQTILAGHYGEVYALAFSPDGELIASGGDDMTIRLWDPVTGSEKRILSGFKSEVYTLAFAPGDGILASGGSDESVRLWDTRTGAEREELAGHDGEVYALAFSPDGATLATGGEDGAVWLWDASSGSCHAILTGNPGEVHALAYSPDGTTIASGGDDGTVRLWNTSNPTDAAGRKTPTDQSGRKYAVAFSPDGATIATGGDYGTAHLWDTATAKVRVSLEGQDGKIYAVAFSHDGATVAGGGEDGTVCLWRVTRHGYQGDLTGHGGEVYAVAFSPDGATLASGGDDLTVRLWDLDDGSYRRTLTGHTGWVRAVAFSPDGAILASGGDDGVVRLWDAAGGGYRGVLTGHTGGVYAVAFSPDGTTLASADDGAIRLWDASTGSERCMLTGHHGGVFAVAFSPDGAIIASGGADGTVRMWDTRTGAVETAFKLGDAIVACAWNADFVACVGRPGLHLLRRRT